MVRTLICLDTDGTLDSGQPKGPINSELLSSIQKIYADELIVFVVSESPYYPKDHNKDPLFPIQNNQPSRWINLQTCIGRCLRKDWKPRICLYVSDNGDLVEARKSGFIYVDAKHFADMFGVSND